VRESVTGLRLAAAALLLAPLLAYAAGLGRLTVLSALGQPLNAEIEIVSLQSGEEDTLGARLAAPEAFRQAGIEMSAALLGVQFAIERRAGRPIVRLRTFQPVNEPFLEILVELQWTTGRLVREYTFLLDPPEYKPPAPVAAAPAPAPTPAVRPAPVPAPAPARPAPRVEARPIAAAPAAAGSYEVQKGDTLSGIASRNRPEGVTLNQMMIALFRANQAAFIRGNINLVRAGRILNVPDRDAITSVERTEANSIVRTHHAEFAEYKSRLAGVVAAAPAVPAPREREVTGKIAPKPPAPAADEPKDRLKLSKADPAKPGAPAARAAREDDRVSRGRALRDAQARVGELEKNVTGLQKLLEMKNQQLAELEKKAAAAKPAPAAPTAPAAKAPEPAKAAPGPAKPAAPEKPAAVAAAKPAAEPAKPAPEKPAAEAPKPAAEAPKPAPDKPAAEAPKPAPEVVAKAPDAAAKPKPKPVAAPPPPPPPSPIEEFIEDPLALGGLGLVVLLLGGYGAWAWRRKKATQSKFQDSVLGAASAPGAAAMLGGEMQPAMAGAAAGAAESQVSVGGAPAAGAAGGDEVDPIAEADVYMAYQRDAQAEEILKEALAKDANRVGVHAKLLEIYAHRRDTKSFEQTALKLKNLTGGAGPEWDKAAALGRSIDPNNGLYGGAAAAGVADDTQALAGAPAAPAPALDFDIGGATEPGAGQAKAVAPASVDFDLGATTSTSTLPAEKSDFAPSGTLVLDTQEAKAASGGLDFDLGGAAPEKAPEPAKAAPADTGLDFDLDIDLGGAKAEAPAKAAEPSLDLGSISLDLGGTTPGAGTPAAGDQKWQEVATKLDLARAYLEMDDKDGARELLNEVLKEGDAAQQGQAKQMLASLG